MLDGCPGQVGSSHWARVLEGWAEPRIRWFEDTKEGRENGEGEQVPRKDPI
jgi:hypothetical protein